MPDDSDSSGEEHWYTPPSSPVRLHNHEPEDLGATLGSVEQGSSNRQHSLDKHDADVFEAESLTDVDFFSRLDDDCIRYVLSKSELDDVETCSTINRRFHALAMECRPQARKPFVDELEIECIRDEVFRDEEDAGNDEETVVFHMNYQGEEYDMHLRETKCTKFRTGDMVDVSMMDIEEGNYYGHATPIDAVAAVLNRFNYGKCIMNYFNVSEKTLSLLEKMPTTFTSFEINQLSVDADDGLSERFLDILLASKPASIEFDIIQVISVDFLQRYAAVVSLPSIGRGDLPLNDIGMVIIVRHVGRDFINVLPSYKNVFLEGFVAVPTGMVSAIAERLRRKVNGSWKCMLSRQLEESDVRDLEHSDPDLRVTFEVLPRRSHFQITLVEKYCVTVNISPYLNSTSEFVFTADFLTIDN